MDSVFAALALIVGLTDMGVNHCPTGCLAEGPGQSRLSVSAGALLFQEDRIGSEVYIRYDLGREFGPFQPTIGLSSTDSGDVWLGAGALWTAPFLDDAAYLQLHLMPGLYLQGDGPNLGNEIEFRSGFEIGITARNGWRWGLSYDHRSNGGLSDLNPGAETVQLRLSIPLG
jgi:hypothetical protein